jgi:hypothetical protein
MTDSPTATHALGADAGDVVVRLAEACIVEPGGITPGQGPGGPSVCNFRQIYHAVSMESGSEPGAPGPRELDDRATAGGGSLNDNIHLTMRNNSYGRVYL